MPVAPPPPENEALRKIATAAARAPTQEMREDDAAMVKRGLPWRVVVAAMSPDIEIWHWYYRERPTRASIGAASQLEGIEFFEFSLTNLVTPTRGSATPSQRREFTATLPTVPTRTSDTCWRRGDPVEAPHLTPGSLVSGSTRWELCTFLQALASVDGEPRYMVRWPGGARTMVAEVRAAPHQTT